MSGNKLAGLEPKTDSGYDGWREVPAITSADIPFGHYMSATSLRLI